jgi:hypothetical protein
MNAVSCARWRRLGGMLAFCSTKSIILMGRFTSTVCTPARSLLSIIGQGSGRPSPVKLGKTNCWDTHFVGIPEESDVLSSWAQRHFGITFRKRFLSRRYAASGSGPSSARYCGILDSEGLGKARQLIRGGIIRDGATRCGDVLCSGLRSRVLPLRTNFFRRQFAIVDLINATKYRL